MAAMSDNARGALLMMGGMASFTINDACLKLLLEDLPLFQTLFLRGIGTVVAFACLLPFWGGFRMDLHRRDWLLIGLRTLSEALAAYLFLTALMHMKLANVSAILQSLPLTVTLGAALFFKEPIGWRRLGAIVVGFGGVMLIVQPGAADFNQYSLMAVGSVLCVTVRDLATRRMSRSVPSMMVSFCAGAGLTAVFGLGSLVMEPWVMPTGLGLGQLLAATVFVIFGYLFSVMSMRVGELSFVAPFRYTSLLCALLLGYVLFDEWPEAVKMLGAVIVVATGAYTFARERRLKRAALASAGSGVATD